MPASYSSAGRSEIKLFFPTALLDEADVAARDDARALAGAAYPKLMPLVTQGMAELAATRPADPCRWLGEWLMARKGETAAAADGATVVAAEAPASVAAAVTEPAPETVATTK